LDFKEEYEIPNVVILGGAESGEIAQQIAEAGKLFLFLSFCFYIYIYIYIFYFCYIIIKFSYLLLFLGVSVILSPALAFPSYFETERATEMKGKKRKEEILDQHGIRVAKNR
jgi:hypothetical protein